MRTPSAARASTSSSGSSRPTAAPTPTRRSRDLEIVPRRKIEYRGVVLEEMDVDAILARKPQMCVVDELAHTNAPGQPAREALPGRARPARRRHQRADGRQHPAPGDAERRGQPRDRRPRARDGARHVPRSRRRSRQRRRDRRRSCRRRLRQGKVYKPEKVEQALTNFFRETNLSTLRELALRAVADEVGEKAASHRQREGLEPALIPERVMVCMSSNADAPRVLRAGARIAGRLGARWYAVYVETPREAPGRIAAADRDALQRNIALAESLGATVVRVKADRPADGLIAFAKREGITHVIFGQSAREPARDPDEGIDTQPVPAGSPRRQPCRSFRWSNRHNRLPRRMHKRNAEVDHKARSHRQACATNGADDVAGSKPMRRSRNGSSDPISVPHSTTPTSASATVMATSSQCGP